MRNENIKQDVLLAFPAYDGKTEVEIAQEMYLSLYDTRVPVKKIHYYNGDSLVTRARNACAAAFMDMDDVDYLLFIDSDIRFQRWQVTRLRQHDKGIVGGVYLKKKLPYQPVCNNRMGYEDGSGLAIMREIGTGFMMIRKDVLKAIMERWPEYRYKHYAHERQSDNYYDWFRVGPCSDTGYYLSEDYYFCKLARECGYEVFLDESILVEHSGKILYPTSEIKLVEATDGLLRAFRDDADISAEMLEAVMRLNESTGLFHGKHSKK